MRNHLANSKKNKNSRANISIWLPLTKKI